MLIHRKRFDKNATKQEKAQEVQKSAEEAALALLTGKTNNNNNNNSRQYDKKEQDAKDMTKLFKSGGRSADKDSDKTPGGPQKRGRPFNNGANNDRNQGRKFDNKKQRQ